jgi:hypothetical protein
MGEVFKYQDGRTIVVVRYGKFKGKYPVYRDEAAFRRDHPDEKIVTPWWDGQAGSWVLCDDGHVGQLIKVSVLRNKKGQETRVYRMPWSSFPLYWRKDGTTGARMEYFKKQNTSKSSMAKKATPRYGKHMNDKKRLFAVLTYGLDVKPHRAYMRAFKTTSIKTANILSRDLMNKEESLLRAEVEQTIQEILNGAGMSLEKAALELKKLVEQDDNKNMKLSAIKAAINLHQHGQLPQPQGVTINTQNNLTPGQQPHQVGGRSVSAPKLPPAEIPAQDGEGKDALEKNAERSQKKLEYMRERQELAREG